MTAGSLSCGNGEVGAPGVCRSNEESRAFAYGEAAQCTLIAIDGDLKEEGEAILRIGNGKRAERQSFPLERGCGR